MYKLSAADAGFLYNETDRTPMHIASVQLMALPPGKGEDEFIDGLKTFLKSRTHLVPYMTNRLQWSPFGMDHPVWVRDRAFDIDHHVHRVDLPSPGGMPELEAKVAQLHEQRLDRSRPLWEMVVICGLADGRIAYYSRVHHACLDGVAGQIATRLLMDTTPEPAQPPGNESSYRADDPYNPAQMVVGMVENFVSAAVSQALTATRTWTTAARLYQRALDPSKGFGAAAERAPRTRFNCMVGQRRSYAVGELSMADVKGVAATQGGTTNDAFLAACGGALRRYLSRLGENPETSLIAGCPVSLRRRSDPALDNQVTMMQVALGTDVADPGERLRRVCHSSRTAKGLTAELAPSFNSQMAFPGLPALQMAAAGLDSMRFAAAPAAGQPPINLVISNVPGPRSALYSNGATMLSHYPVSVVAHGLAVNITVQSYVDTLYFAVTGCAQVLPDPDRLRDDLLAEMRVMKALVPQERPAPAPEREPVVEVSLRDTLPAAMTVAA